MVEVPQHLKGRDFIRIGTWNSEELKTVLDLADELKYSASSASRTSSFRGGRLG